MPTRPIATRPRLCSSLLIAALGCVDPAQTDTSTTTTTLEGSTDATSSPTTDTTDTTDAIDTVDTDALDTTEETGPIDEPGACDELEVFAEMVAAEPDPETQTALLHAFVASQLDSLHGFPLVDGTRLCVVHEGAEGQALSLAGDFDAWDPDAYPLTEVAPGIHYGSFELDAPPSGLYKLVDGGGVYFADPLARRHGWDEFGEYSQIDPIPGRPHHERWPGFEPNPNGIAASLAPRTLTVWLPADASAEPELPVLYMHDGQNLFAPDALFGGWRVGETVAEAIAADLLPPLIVVGVDNTADRFDEYTQTTDLVNGFEVGGRADEYAAFLVEDVVPFIESRYAVATTPDRVATMGSSLGGLVSLYLGLEHPEVFGSVASLSGTVGWGSLDLQNPTIADAYLATPPAGLRIYLDSGGDEGFGCPDDGSDNYCDNVAFANTLRGLGWVDETDLFYRWDPGAPHNELAWADRLLPALLDWFPI